MRAMGERSEPSARDGATSERWARGGAGVEPGCVMEPKAKDRERLCWWSLRERSELPRPATQSVRERATSALMSSLAERVAQLTRPSGVVYREIFLQYH